MDAGTELSLTRLRALPLPLTIGTASGALLLGLGGRLVMRLFALASGRPGAFSLRGTLNVVFAGAVAGVIGGALFWAVERWLPRRSLLRGLAFGLLCFAIASPGIRPPQLLTFGLFAPFFLGYGLLLAYAWVRVARQEQKP